MVTIGEKKELSLEARHSICQEISRKRRQSVASSIFMPRESKRFRPYSRAGNDESRNSISPEFCEIPLIGRNSMGAEKENNAHQSNNNEKTSSHHAKCYPLNADKYKESREQLSVIIESMGNRNVDDETEKAPPQVENKTDKLIVETENGQSPSQPSETLEVLEVEDDLAINDDPNTGAANIQCSQVESTSNDKEVKFATASDLMQITSEVMSYGVKKEMLDIIKNEIDDPHNVNLELIPNYDLTRASVTKTSTEQWDDMAYKNFYAEADSSSFTMTNEEVKQFLDSAANEAVGVAAESAVQLKDEKSFDQLFGLKCELETPYQSPTTTFDARPTNRTDALQRENDSTTQNAPEDGPLNLSLNTSNSWHIQQIWSNELEVKVEDNWPETIAQAAQELEEQKQQQQQQQQQCPQSNSQQICNSDAEIVREIQAKTFAHSFYSHNENILNEIFEKTSKAMMPLIDYKPNDIFRDGGLLSLANKLSQETDAAINGDKFLESFDKCFANLKSTMKDMDDCDRTVSAVSENLSVKASQQAATNDFGAQLPQNMSTHSIAQKSSDMQEFSFPQIGFKRNEDDSQHRRPTFAELFKEPRPDESRGPAFGSYPDRLTCCASQKNPTNSTGQGNDLEMLRTQTLSKLVQDNPILSSMLSGSGESSTYCGRIQTTSTYVPAVMNAQSANNQIGSGANNQEANRKASPKKNPTPRKRRNQKAASNSNASSCQILDCHENQTAANATNKRNNSYRSRNPTPAKAQKNTGMPINLRTCYSIPDLPMHSYTPADDRCRLQPSHTVHWNNQETAARQQHQQQQQQQQQQQYQHQLHQQISTDVTIRSGHPPMAPGESSRNDFVCCEIDQQYPFLSQGTLGPLRSNEVSSTMMNYPPSQPPPPPPPPLRHSSNNSSIDTTAFGQQDFPPLQSIRKAVNGNCPHSFQNGPPKLIPIPSNNNFGNQISTSNTIYRNTPPPPVLAPHQTLAVASTCHSSSALPHKSIGPGQRGQPSTMRSASSANCPPANMNRPSGQQPVLYQPPTMPPYVRQTQFQQPGNPVYNPVTLNGIQPGVPTPPQGIFVTHFVPLQHRNWHGFHNGGLPPPTPPPPPPPPYALLPYAQMQSVQHFVVVPPMQPPMQPWMPPTQHQIVYQNVNAQTQFAYPIENCSRADGIGPPPFATCDAVQGSQKDRPLNNNTQ